MNMADMDLDPIIEKIGELLKTNPDLKADPRVYVALLLFGIAGLATANVPYAAIVDLLQQALLRVTSSMYLPRMADKDFPGGLQ